MSSKSAGRLNEKDKVQLSPVDLGKGEIAGRMRPTNRRGAWADLTYGTTVTPNEPQHDLLRITVTDTVAFTIANPQGLDDGMAIVLVIKNSSGGAMGTITWGSQYKLAGGSFTNPADTKRRAIAFVYDSAVPEMLELYRSSGDI